MRWRSRFAYIVLIIYALLTLFPFYWTLITSFKEEQEILSLKPDWFPEPTLKHYKTLIRNRPVLVQYTINSITVAAVVSGLSLVLAIPAGYGFGRYRTRATRMSFGMIIGSRMLPSIAFVVPFAIIYSKLNIIDTKFGLIMAHLFFTLPFAIWLLEGFYASLPKELEDAARIDGCTNFQTFWRVEMPLVRSGVIAAAILAFLYSWWEYPFAVTLMRQTNRTLPVGIVTIFKDDFVIWNHLAAATIISVIPGVVFIIFFQRFIVAGMVQGSVKE